MKPTATRRTGAIGAVIAAAALALALAVPAHADSSSLPDGTKTANLHITKYQTPAGSQGDGTQQNPAPSNTPIAGVTFTIKQVNTIDLTTQAGWQNAGKLATDYNAAAPTSTSGAESAITADKYTLGSASTATTASDGTANFTGLPLGLYLVEETATPAGVTPANPFLVTLPMTNPSSTSAWNYDVYVYPKNAVSTATKTVTDDTATGVGSPVTFTVKGDIPDATGDPQTAPLTAYKMEDQLDTKLDYVSSTVALADGTALPAADYTITPSQATAGGPDVTVVFNADGLALLGKHRDTQVVWTINTKANAAGNIQNTAALYPDQSAVDGKNPTKSNTVITKWGNVTVKKQAQSGTALAGATFQVYATNSCSTKPNLSSASPVSVGSTNSWTTGSDGTLTISGLRYSAWADNQTVADGATGYNCYWLVETKAPTGYELQAEPISFTVDDSTTADGVDTTVTDVPHNAGFQLPFTGGTGSTVITLVGMGLVAAAVVVAFVVYRRRRAAQQ